MNDIKNDFHIKYYYEVSEDKDTGFETPEEESVNDFFLRYWMKKFVKIAKMVRKSLIKEVGQDKSLHPAIIYTDMGEGMVARLCVTKSNGENNSMPIWSVIDIWPDDRTDKDAWEFISNLARKRKLPEYYDKALELDNERARLVPNLIFMKGNYYQRV